VLRVSGSALPLMAGCLTGVGLATTSIDLASGSVVKTTGVQHDYVITTQRWPFCWPDGRHGSIGTPVVAVISVCLLCPALSVMLVP